MANYPSIISGTPSYLEHWLMVTRVWSNIRVVTQKSICWKWEVFFFWGGGGGGGFIFLKNQQHYNSISLRIGSTRIPLSLKILLNGGTWCIFPHIAFKGRELFDICCFPGWENPFIKGRICFRRSECYSYRSKFFLRCTTLHQTILCLLRHFVESFFQITSLSKSPFIKCIFFEYDT